MYRLFWIDREKENQVKLFEDDRFKRSFIGFKDIEEGISYINFMKTELPKAEYVILPYFKID